MAKKVAVIGAGASGLAAIKCCLDEGLIPVCFERSREIGGLWNYTDGIHDDRACVMNSTVINSSKEMMSYSDFPTPKEYPNFMHNTEVCEYLNLYADQFELKKHIRFEEKVIRASQSSDFAKSGKWELETLNEITNAVRRETFDALLVCSGHHAERNIPHFPGEDFFQGEMLHSQQYKDPTGYGGKRVVIVGIGNSGGDVAAELSKMASQTFLSTRRGAWIVGRTDKDGLPADLRLATRERLSKSALVKLDFNEINDRLESVLNASFDHERYGLKPKHRFLSQHPTVNEKLSKLIAKGCINIKPNIKCFTKTGVVFDDDTFEDDIDFVILSTGYKIGFPFIDKSVINVENNQVNLYKYVFPPNLARPTLAVIGCFQPLGGLMPLSELQCRWATRVFKRLSEIPCKADMWSDIAEKRRAMDERYVSSPRHTIQVDWLPYMDELADQVGCKPNPEDLKRTDPVLAERVFSGPCTPYQFRLVGSLSWSGARNAIMTQWERILHPSKSQITQSRI